MVQRHKMGAELHTHTHQRLENRKRKPRAKANKRENGKGTVCLTVSLVRSPLRYSTESRKASMTRIFLPHDGWRLNRLPQSLAEFGSLLWGLVNIFSLWYRVEKQHPRNNQSLVHYIKIIILPGNLCSKSFAHFHLKWRKFCKIMNCGSVVVWRGNLPTISQWNWVWSITSRVLTSSHTALEGDARQILDTSENSSGKWSTG